MKRDSIKHKLRGARSILDWLGPDETPVSRSVAEGRGCICLVCAYNRKGDWYSHVLDRLGKAARQIKAYRSELELRTMLDRELGICEVCECPLALKVWVSPQFIAETLDEAVEKKLPDFCWQRCA